MRTAITLLLASVLLCACQTNPFAPKSDEAPPVELLENEGMEAAPVPESGLPLAVEQRFKDIPLPMDVREDVERTYVYETEEIQVGRMVYSSKASVAELASFFIKECPAAEWQRESILQVSGVQLVFSKPGKRLQIDIQEQGVGRSRLLIINLMPLPN